MRVQKHSHAFPSYLRLANRANPHSFPECSAISLPASSAVPLPALGGSRMASSPMKRSCRHGETPFLIWNLQRLRSLSRGLGLLKLWIFHKKLTVNFVLPYSSQFSHKEVDMVIIPATTGHLGILPEHVATITELQPGVLSVEGEHGVKKYFVSSGFAFIHSNSFAEIVAAEAVPVDQLNATLVQEGLAEFTRKLSSASTDLERAEAEIGVNVHTALNSALSV